MMGEKTGIVWCDHTFNPWIGCQKVSDGCKNCYAARDNNRYHWVGEWGRDYRRTSAENWKKPIQWAKQAVKDGVIRRVFCASLADVFDASVLDEWRTDLLDLICTCAQIGGVEWLILTKRPENIEWMLPKTWIGEPRDYIRIGVTAENQVMADKRIPELLRNWSGKNFISAEPMLSDIDLRDFTEKIDWLICGCESGPNSRKTKHDWVRNLRYQCVFGGVPFFLKQLMIDNKLIVLPSLDDRVWYEFPKEKDGEK
jgi:protein gp37